MRQFFDDADAFWRAHPRRLLPIIASATQRALVAQALALRELAPDSRRPIVVFEERFTATGPHFYGLAEKLAERYEIVRAGLAEDGVALPALAGSAGTMPSGALECAAAAMERAARLLAEPVDGLVVALVPKHVGDPKAWREAVRMLAARAWSPRVRVVVLATKGGPLDDIGRGGVLFHVNPDELLAHCLGTEDVPRSGCRQRDGLIVALAQIERSIEVPRDTEDRLLERLGILDRKTPAGGEPES